MSTPKIKPTTTKSAGLLNYEYLKQCEERIFKLKMFRGYIASMLKKEIFSVTMNVTMLGTQIYNPFNSYNVDGLNPEQNKDADFILKQIDTRIKFLENEFNKLK